MSDQDHRLLSIRRRDRAQLERERELSRRRFLQLASSVSIAACSHEPGQPLLPYTYRPSDVVPGVPTYYATALCIDGYATGLVAQTREGRPLKIEGNPEHPTSLGATSAFHQAAVLQLYDPDRAGAVQHRRQPSSWRAFREMLRSRLHPRGKGLRLLLEPTSSPLVLALLDDLKQRLPDAKATLDAPLFSQSPAQAGSALFGRPLIPQYDIGAARVLVTLDSDLLGNPHDLRHARAFAEGRHIERPGDRMLRHYNAETCVTITGSMADNRLALKAAEVTSLTAALAQAVVPAEMLAVSSAGDAKNKLSPQARRWVKALAKDLRSRPSGSTLVVCGERQPPEVHVLCHAINAALGNIGRTVHFSEPPVTAAASDQTLAALVKEMQSGAVDTLVMFESNPCYSAPSDLAWTEAMQRVPHKVYCGMYVNETAANSDWFAPVAHPFEIWSDARSYDGTLTYSQPLIRKLNDGKSISELLAIIADLREVEDRVRLRVRYGQERGEGLTLAMSAAERAEHERREVRESWEATLASGFVPGTAFSLLAPKPAPDATKRAFRAAVSQAKPGGIELNFMRSATLHDGRFANVSWLLELPDPILQLTWDNAAILSSATAARLGVPKPSSELDYPVVELQHAGRSLRVPAVVLPGHADDAVSIWLGYGRDGEELLARGVGFNANLLRTSTAPCFAESATLKPTEETYPLAFTQPHHDMLDRPIGLSTTLDRYRKEPDFTRDSKGDVWTLLPEWNLKGPQWAMTIDLSKCTGCSACVVACQAENNLPVVGKEQVMKSRAMHWLRIDSYFNSDESKAGVIHQPMMCQHCEKAPCEYVCPVNATVHSTDGLNEMVYNRCVGTRFCSNNCPYKVRRFNWFNWYKHEGVNEGRVELQRNPEVTVRERGVMEKCTYCVQRIRQAEITARVERRGIRPNEVVTACQQACPTRAISFGSLTHKQTEMVRWRGLDRSYQALHETGAKPRTMYLARIDDPNPELES